MKPSPALLALASLALLTCGPSVVEVHPGDDLQALVYANPAGTVFLIKTGVHRQQKVIPRDGNSFTGEPGAVLSGAVVLTGWVFDGRYWTLSGQTYEGTVHGYCTDGNTGCSRPEDLFFDDVPLWQETGLADLDQSGEWFFDYAADTIYVLDDPTQATVELSVTSYAFHGFADRVTIQGLTIEKYATIAQHGAIRGWYQNRPATNWTVQENTLRWNHGAAITVGNGFRVLRNQIVSNGHIGIAGGGVSDVLIQDNTIQGNNYAGFLPTWEGGGAKWTRVDGLTVRGNMVVENEGFGLWTDIDSIDVLYERNVVVANSYGGIHHEISYAAVICNNTVIENGKASAVWLWGAQILISSSRDVVVCDNSVVVGRDGGNGITLIQQSRGVGIHGPHVTVGNRVRGNSVTYLGDGGVTGGDADWEPDTMFDGSNVFGANSYFAPDATRLHWAWRGAWRDWWAWQSVGQDPTGSVQLTNAP